MGRRISKTVDSITTYFIYDPQGRVIAEYEDGTTPTLQKEYVWGNGINEILAMFNHPELTTDPDDWDEFLGFCAAWLSDPNDTGVWDNAYDLVDDDFINLRDFAELADDWEIYPETETRYYYLTDALGSVRGLVGGRYNREDDREFYNYDVYGKLSVQIAETSKSGNPILFAGYRYDAETGLYHTPNRKYNPNTGWWLQMDKDYFDSYNLYEYTGSNPVMRVDPLGLAFYAVGGTWEKASDKANAWQLYSETTEKPKYYWKGPGFLLGSRKLGTARAIHGRDSRAKMNQVKEKICKDFCEAKKDCGKDLEINMTGWSRGATIVMGVAKELNDEGCKCGWLFKKCYKPVQVNWIGLFDAVEMIYDTIPGTIIPKEVLPGDNAWPDSVPPNVKFFTHAIKTEKQLIFPTTRFGKNNNVLYREKEFYRYDGTKTEHSDIGESFKKGNNDAYQWIKMDAILSGVDF